MYICGYIAYVHTCVVQKYVGLRKRRRWWKRSNPLPCIGSCKGNQTWRQGSPCWPSWGRTMSAHRVWGGALRSAAKWVSLKQGKDLWLAVVCVCWTFLSTYVKPIQISASVSRLNSVTFVCTAYINYMYSTVCSAVQLLYLKTCVRSSWDSGELATVCVYVRSVLAKHTYLLNVLHVCQHRSFHCIDRSPFPREFSHLPV